MSIADTVKQLVPNATPEQIAAVEQALAPQVTTLGSLPTADKYDPNKVPVAEDPIIKWLNVALQDLAAAAGFAASVAPGTPVSAIASAVAAQMAVIQKLLDALVVEAEKLAFNAGLRP